MPLLRDSHEGLSLRLYCPSARRTGRTAKSRISVQGGLVSRPVFRDPELLVISESQGVAHCPFPQAASVCWEKGSRSGFVATKQGERSIHPGAEPPFCELQSESRCQKSRTGMKGA